MVGSLLVPVVSCALSFNVLVCSQESFNCTSFSALLFVASRCLKTGGEPLRSFSNGFCCNGSPLYFLGPHSVNLIVLVVSRLAPC